MGEGFSEGVACRVGVGHRNNEFVLAISQYKGVVFDVVQWTRTVSRVIRAITTGQAALRLVDKLRLLTYPKELKSTEPFQLLETTPEFIYQAQSGLTGRDGPDNPANGARPLYNVPLCAW